MIISYVYDQILEDLYEQCSFHIAEKIPSSTKFGFLPINLIILLYSSAVRPCFIASS